MGTPNSNLEAYPITKVIKEVVKTMDSGKKGNLTAKTFYKTRKDASQRVMDIDKSLLPTSETYFGAILSEANIPQMVENPSVGDEYSVAEGSVAIKEARVSLSRRLKTPWR